MFLYKFDFSKADIQIGTEGVLVMWNVIPVEVESRHQMLIWGMVRTISYILFKPTEVI